MTCCSAEEDERTIRAVLSVECGPEEVYNYIEIFGTEIQDSVFQGGFSVADFVEPDQVHFDA